MTNIQIIALKRHTHCEKNLMDMYRKVNMDLEGQPDPTLIKYFKHSLSLIIFALNGDGNGYKKRLKKFKQHQQVALEYVMENTDRTTLIFTDEKVLTEYNREGALTKFADYLKADYEFYTMKELIELICDPAWKKYRQPSA
jgi:hypothetical protein